MNIPEGLVPVALEDQQKKDLLRFHETTEDDQGYDVPKDRMKKLARIGLVRSLGFSRYELTDVGVSVVEALTATKPQPAAHLTIPGALEWDGDNGTHGADGESLAHGDNALVTLADAQPVAMYQYRTKPKWDAKHPWSNWDECSEGAYADYMAATGDWNYEVRKLYTSADAGEVERFKAANAELSELNVSRRRHLNNAKKAAGIGPLDDLVGAIEALRAQLTNLEQSRRSFFDLSQDLEKRLAERDAAIKEFIRINGMSVQNSAANNKALLALAAIVEPAKPKTCIECDQPHCHGVCVERGDEHYDWDQAAKGGEQ